MWTWRCDRLHTASDSSRRIFSVFQSVCVLYVLVWMGDYDVMRGFLFWTFVIFMFHISLGVVGRGISIECIYCFVCSFFLFGADGGKRILYWTLMFVYLGGRGLVH